MGSTFTIWTNAKLPEDAAKELAAGVKQHRLIVSSQLSGNLVGGPPDPLLGEADVAFGQPDVGQAIALSNLKWVQLTTAGYTRYDRADVRAALKNRGGMLSNASGVFSEPCAEHALAFMLSGARRLADAEANKITARGWPQTEIRRRSHLLSGQTAIILGMGAIGLRLIELLLPLKMNLIGIRQKVRGDEGIETHSIEQLDSVLPLADHVINLLPSSVATDHFFNASRFGRMKTGAIFYNIGRGTTVVQGDLLEALLKNKLQAAYLDVTDPEPLPPEHPLWLAANCHITPHTAGGHEGEFRDVVRHFLENLRRFENGMPLIDRVM